MKFHEDIRVACPKCGVALVDATHRKDGEIREGEWLDLECGRCGYSYQAKCYDVVATQKEWDEDGPGNWVAVE